MLVSYQGKVTVPRTLLRHGLTSDHSLIKNTRKTNKHSNPYPFFFLAQTKLQQATCLAMPCFSRHRFFWIICLLNFDSLLCWAVIVLTSLVYDYIKLMILPGFHFLFSNTTGEDEMKWGTVRRCIRIYSENTTLAAYFITIALWSVKAWHQNKRVLIIFCSCLWVRICNLREVYDIRMFLKN